MSIYNTYFEDVSDIETECHLQDATIQIISHEVRKYDCYGELRERYQKPKSIKIFGESMGSTVGIEITGNYDVKVDVDKTEIKLGG